MKKVQNFMMMFILSSLTVSIYSQKLASWKEMEDFHAVMSISFHPAEEDNLKPVMENAEDLLNKAISWKQSKAPQGYNEATTSSVLMRLVKQCEILKVAVENKKSDAELKLLITEAHDIFHEIMERCRKKEGH